MEQFGETGDIGYTDVEKKKNTTQY
jgi:hypothetical protein